MCKKRIDITLSLTQNLIVYQIYINMYKLDRHNELFIIISRYKQII